MPSRGVTEDIFGYLPKNNNTNDAWIIKRFTITNTAGSSVQVITYGATVTSIRVPDKNGVFEDVVLGFDEMASYFGTNNRRFGASIGRVANRIGKGKFTLDDIEYQLPLNDGENHIHGGFLGFDKRMWESYVDGYKVIFSRVSADGEEGYPGALIAHITMELTNDNRLQIDNSATTTKSCPVNLTNHSYFNLSGHKNADKQLEGHYIRLNADQYTPVDEQLIATGEIRDVQSTMYDLRTSQHIYDLLQEYPEGYDNNFCINDGPGDEDIRFVGRVHDEISGRAMDIYSNQPGIQFYTANFLPEDEPIIGKEGARYLKQGSFCAESQNYPNAINLPNFPNSVLRPGVVYSHKIHYHFSFITKKSKRRSKK